MSELQLVTVYSLCHAVDIGGKELILHRSEPTSGATAKESTSEPPTGGDEPC